MSDSIPTNPTPTAVPWSPEMMTPQTAVPNPAQDFRPLQPQMAAEQYQPAQQYHAPQSDYAPPTYPQQPESYAAPPQMHPAEYAPAPQPQYAPPPQRAPDLQPVHHMQQSAPPQIASAAAVPYQMPQPGRAQIARQPQYAQPAPPPPLPSALPPQMHLAALSQTDPAVQTSEKSKSLVASRLKRSPHPAQTEHDFEKSGKSGTLINKGFILGTVTGLLIGAFALPMALSAFGGNASEQAQTQAGTTTEFNPAPAASNGDTFIDNALATDTP